METLITLSRELAIAVDRLRFLPPTSVVYNPLAYARDSYETYLRRCGSGRRRVLFWGMNPGPWGMAQTGIPFGEVGFVRDWMGIESRVAKPAHEHPKRPIDGFACRRSEVSGRRLWGLMKARFGSASAFFADHLVMNWCPLLFMEQSGRNRTPDKLPGFERAKLYQLCDDHMAAVIRAVRPVWIIGVGKFALDRIRQVLDSDPASFHGAQSAAILHPSPASPKANHDWAGLTENTLVELGVWGKSG